MILRRGDGGPSAIKFNNKWLKVVADGEVTQQKCMVTLRRADLSTGLLRSLVRWAVATWRQEAACCGRAWIWRWWHGHHCCFTLSPPPKGRGGSHRALAAEADVVLWCDFACIREQSCMSKNEQWEWTLTLAVPRDVPPCYLSTWRTWPLEGLLPFLFSDGKKRGRELSTGL